MDVCVCWGCKSSVHIKENTTNYICHHERILPLMHSEHSQNDFTRHAHFTMAEHFLCCAVRVQLLQQHTKRAQCFHAQLVIIFRDLFFFFVTEINWIYMTEFFVFKDCNFHYFNSYIFMCKKKNLVFLI